MIAFYEEDVTWQGALWTPAAECKRAKGHVPRLLHVPLVLFILMRRESRPLMPHEVLAMIIKHLEETRATNEQRKAWDIVVKWCIVAAKKDAQGDSLVLFTVKAVTEGGDLYFEQWVEQQLNAMMGVRPAQEPLGGMSLTAQNNTVPAQFAAELSKG
jgi:hypothetical protein